MQIQFLTLMLEFEQDTSVSHIHLWEMPSPQQAHPELSSPCLTEQHCPRSCTSHWTTSYNCRAGLSHKGIVRQLFQSGTELWGRQRRNTAACPAYTDGSVLFHDRWWKVFRLPTLGRAQLHAGVANTDSQMYWAGYSILTRLNYSHHHHST